MAFGSGSDRPYGTSEHTPESMKVVKTLPDVLERGGHAGAAAELRKALEQAGVPLVGIGVDETGGPHRGA